MQRTFGARMASFTRGPSKTGGVLLCGRTM
jgi:hypothetical protein